MENEKPVLAIIKLISTSDTKSVLVARHKQMVAFLSLLNGKLGKPDYEQFFVQDEKASIARYRYTCYIHLETQSIHPLLLMVEAFRSYALLHHLQPLVVSVS